LPQLVTRLSAFCKSSTLLSRIESFCKQHVNILVGQTGSSEFPLEFTVLHSQYCALVETALEDFLAKQQITADSFYAECKACLDRSQQESRWNRDAMVVQVFTASNEFQEWVSLMHAVADHDASDNDSDDADSQDLHPSPVPLS